MEFDIEIRIVDEGRPDIRELVSVSEFGEGQVLEQGGLKGTALRVDHPPVTDCFALRFDHGGKSVVFSADTAFFPPLADFAKGADILVHEAMLEDGIERLVARTGNGARLRQHLLASHSLAEEAGRIASDAGVKRLVLNHLIPADDPEIGEADWITAVRKTWAGDLTIARDGLVVELSGAKAAQGEETA
jgi:ribonuclease BN (tRNA processing enzyme)